MRERRAFGLCAKILPIFAPSRSDSVERAIAHFLQKSCPALTCPPHSLQTFSGLGADFVGTEKVLPLTSRFRCWVSLVGSISSPDARFDRVPQRSRAIYS